MRKELKIYYPKGWFDEGEEPDSGADPFKVIDEALSQRHPGITQQRIMGKQRTKSVVLARQDCVRSVSEARPDLSSTELGKIFGVDHTSILYMLGRLDRKPTIEKKTLKYG